MAAGAVTVCCRIRPRVAKADLSSGFDALLLDDRSVQPRDRGAFTFDAVFGPASSQQELFDRVAKPLVEAALSGINATIMCYGQTGSGKTHTMSGSGEGEGRGIAPRVVDSIFTAIEEAPDTMEFTLRVSYLEIYMEVGGPGAGAGGGGV
jgi:kinesin family member 5